MIAALPRTARSSIGMDFGRSGDLSVLIPLLEGQALERISPFIVEMRNVPFRQQEQIVFWIADRLPRFNFGAFDARGNGQYLAEVAMQRYLRNTLWQQGYAVDTVETACDWPHVEPMMRAMEAAAREALAAFGVRAHAYTHLSHLYPQGSSVYSTFIFPLAPGYDENLARWQALKQAVSLAIGRHGGTISHQHGVGRDHAPYLPAEKGPLGMEALGALVERLDPEGLMNSGNLGV